MGHPGPCRILRVKGQAKPQPHFGGCGGFPGVQNREGTKLTP